MKAQAVARGALPGHETVIARKLIVSKQSRSNIPGAMNMILLACRCP